MDRGGKLCFYWGGKTMIVTYQEHDFCSNDSHNLALYLKDESYRTPLIQQYLVGALTKSLSKKYSWGDSISKKKIQNDTVKLPIISGTLVPDYLYMEKVAVKEMIDCKDKIISLMGDVIGVK